MPCGAARTSWRILSRAEGESVMEKLRRGGCRNSLANSVHSYLEWPGTRRLRTASDLR